MKDKELINLIKSNPSYLDVVKQYKESTGCSIKEAKEYCDQAKFKIHFNLFQ